MRCLYCNKELALLKRLTGGAEFCSDLHRKKYQEEFNDLALSRLLQAPATPPAEPLVEPEPEPEPLPEPVARTASPRPRSATSAAPKLVSAAAPAVERKPRQPKDPAVAGYLIEEPVGTESELVVAMGEPPFEAPATPELPSHAFEAAATESGFSRANPIAIRLTIERSAVPIRPRDGNLEIREFSRQAVAPAPPPQQNISTHDPALSSALGEAMEILNQPRPPADPPTIWQAGPHPAPPIDLALGQLSRLDFAVTDIGEDVPPEHTPRPAKPFSTAPPVPSVDPVAAAPALPSAVPVEILQAAAPQPVVGAQPSSAVVPDPVTTPLPIALHGVGAGAAKPAAIISSGTPASIEPQVPASSALPLRPTITLGPRTAPVPVATPLAPPPPSPEPKPVVAAPVPPVVVQPAPQPAPTPVPAPVVAAPPPPPPPVTNSAPVRPVRGNNGKNRRPEIRVVQAGAQPSVPVEQQAIPIAPTTAPVARVQVTQVTPVKAEPPKAAPKPEPVKAAKPEIDLNLPVLHNPEVVGPWGRLPIAAKAGIGAVVALGIVGLAYNVFNGSNATAKTTVGNAIPSYQLGKQINSSGWMEDWAPAGSSRHITLLRGSQPYSDYRIEFQAQIQRKAIGWMYRGLNPRNYYVVKLEKLKSGIEPEVALVRYAVIDGENEKRTEIVLPMKVRVDTTYKVRFDAVGSEFAVWVQDKKIDAWHDSRLGSGGVGLYAEGDEAAAVNGTVNVFELVSTK